LDLAFFDFEVFDIESSGEIMISGPEAAELMLVVEEVDFISHKALISKIMSAINFDLDQDIRICLLRQAQNINLAHHVHSPDIKVIVFGVNPKRISMNASFRANHFYRTETFEIMLTHALEALHSNVSYKKALWAILQKKFISDAR
jgi:DNA polymerase III psi subunit